VLIHHCSILMQSFNHHPRYVTSAVYIVVKQHTETLTITAKCVALLPCIRDSPYSDLRQTGYCDRNSASVHAYSPRRAFAAFGPTFPRRAHGSPTRPRLLRETQHAQQTLCRNTGSDYAGPTVWRGRPSRDCCCQLAV